MTDIAAVPYDLIVLAGGAGSRLGGVDKAALAVGGVSLLERVLAAGHRATSRVVVGGERAVPPGAGRVRWTIESPPGGGPVAALAAGLAPAPLLPQAASPYVVVLAVDLALVAATDVDRLLGEVAGREGAIAVDVLGRDQPLLAVYERAALERALRTLGEPAGRSMRALVAGLDLARIPLGEATTDVDTVADLEAARARLG